MPTYEYECTSCGFKFDKFQSITEAQLTSCLKCQGKLRRLIGKGSGIIFKGAGFYATDYRKEKPDHKPKGSPKSKSKESEK